VDVKPAVSATGKELINQLFYSLIKERALYVRAGTDAIIVTRLLIPGLNIDHHNIVRASLLPPGEGQDEGI
jgi:hypothetical protein